MNLCKLFQVVLKKGNFLLLRGTSASIIAVKLNALQGEFQDSAKPCRNSRGRSGISEFKLAKDRKVFQSLKLQRIYFICSFEIFRGCIALYKENKPFLLKNYVGILKRKITDVRGKKHFPFSSSGRDF